MSNKDLVNKIVLEGIALLGMAYVAWCIIKYGLLYLN